MIDRCYWYISFSNTLIHLVIMAGWVRFQLAICLSLLKNATNTFIESSATGCFILKRLSYSRTKFQGRNLDCHSFRSLDILCWKQRKTSCSVINRRPLALGGWRQRIEVPSWATGQTSCHPKSEDARRSFCSYLTNIMNFSKHALKKSITIELCEKDHPWNILKHVTLPWWILKP